jgi:glycosyltransferase involved in cell wall biosynthesis
MKIVHSLSHLDFSHGGPVRAIIDLSNALVHHHGHQVRVLTIDSKDAPDDWAREGANPTTIQLPKPPRIANYCDKEGKDVIREAVRDADIVHIHGIWMPHQTQVARIAHEMGKPYAISCRGMLDDWCMEQRKLKKLIYLKFAYGSWMLNNAAMIHCTAEGELAQSKKWFPKAPATVIPNLLDLEPFENMPGVELAHEKFPFFDTGDPVLLYLSRLHYKKGVEHLIDAMKILVEQGNPHRLHVVGSGDDAYLQKLKDQTTRLGLDEYVSFPGLVVGDEKISMYNAADMFVLPTSQENFGFVLYEALAAGTPLITTKGVDTWPELESEGGAVISEQDAQKLAEHISSLTSDREALKERGQQGREWIFSEMNPKNIVDRFHKMYLEATGNTED